MSESSGSAPTAWSPRSIDGPARPAPGPVLHARGGRGLGRGSGRAPLPAARLLLRARVRDRRLELAFLLEAVGPGTARLAALEPGEGLRARRARWAWASGPPAGGDAAAARGRRDRRGAAPVPGTTSWRAADRADRAARLPLRRARRGGARCSPAEPQLATDDGSVGPPARSSPSCCASELDGRPARRPSSPAARRRCSRRCGRSAPSAACRPSSPSSPAWPAASGPASAACVPTTDGYVRLCVDGPVLDAERARDRARRGGGALTAPGRAIELCGVALRGPVLNGSGTFDAIAARRAFGDALLERFPFDAFVSKTITLEPRAGQPAAAPVGDARGPDQLDRAAEQGPRGLPRLATCPSSPSCRCRWWSR